MVFKLKIPHCIYSGMIPDYHILDALFALADENKEGKYTPSYYNCPNLTILYIFQIIIIIKKKHA